MKKMRSFVWSFKIYVAVLALLYSPSLLNAQLIQNGNFETVGSYAKVLNGTSGWVSSNFPTGWVSPTDGTPDVINEYYNGAGIGACYDPSITSMCFPQICIGDNKFGCEPERVSSSSLFNYMGITTAGPSVNNPNSTEFREYLQVHISDTDPNTSGYQALQAGQCYQLDFYVSLADFMTKCTPIQVLVSPTAITHYGNWVGILPTNAAGSQLLESKLVDQKTGWRKLSFNFTAIGGEEYITIGFFEDESSTKIKDCYSAHSPGCNSSTCTPSGAPYNYAYYFIDDVSLYPAAASDFIPDLIVSNGTLSGSHVGEDILLSGYVQINGNTNLKGCTVKCTWGTTIGVLTGYTLTVDNTTIAAGCLHMWNGITLQGGATIRVKNQSVISDALTAITGTVATIKLEASTFSGNENDLNITTPYGASYIKGITFDHSMLLKDQNYGINGHGITAINIKDFSSAFTIGGPNTSDICYFIDGQYGIQSTNASLNIQRCFFSEIKQSGIDFQGNAPANAIRKLTVTSSAFANNKRHIVSLHKTDLTVQSSSFANSGEHAIDWEDNHDCHLLIGDPTNASLGNSFQYNAWCDVVAWDNGTTQTDAYTNATNTSNLYTSIVIARNEIYVPPYGGGILVGEWTLSASPTYHSLNVSKNTVHGSIKGIQVYNIHGWGGIPAVTSLSNLPAQDVFANMSYTTTSQTPSPFAIKVKNAPGLSISENGVVSDNPGNYLNYGIVVEDSPYSEIYGNIENAGTCIQLGLDMTGSNVHCNTFGNYSAGFALNFAWLRTGPSDLHGSTAEEYNNAVPYTSYPWNTDIMVYNSLKQLNQWVWNGAGSNLTIAYSGNTGTGSSLISTTTGTNQCSGLLGYPLYAVGGTNTHIIFSSDPYSQWRADYTYESIRQATGNGDSTIVSDTIKKIIAIEDKIVRGAFGEAKTLLSSLLVASGIETNYKDVLTIFADINDSIKRDPDSTELATLTSIAALNTRTGGNAVTLARSFLAVRYNLYFEDERDHTGEVYGTATISTPCALESESHIMLGLMDEDGNALDMDTSYVYQDGSFALDPNKIAYYSTLNPTTKYRIYSKQGSQYTVVDHTFLKLNDWLTSSPYTLTLSGVAVAIDTITEEAYEEIGFNTSVFDAAGNMYKVSIHNGASTDFLLEKKDSDGKPVWSRLYDGPVSGDDTVTCVALDDAGNIYVAGKVFNGASYDVQVVKYDPNGYILWESTVADENQNDNKPTGIYVDSEDQSVHLVATVRDSTGIIGYRFIKFWQCLPSESRLAQTASNEDMATSASSIVAFYPNPSDGSITIVAYDLNGTVELYNLEGQLVFAGTPDKQGKIDLPEQQVNDGIYLLKFTVNGESAFNKIVIHHN
jgi:hypothetical protein